MAEVEWGSNSLKYTVALWFKKTKSVLHLKFNTEACNYGQGVHFSIILLRAHIGHSWFACISFICIAHVLFIIAKNVLFAVSKHKKTIHLFTHFGDTFIGMTQQTFLVWNNLGTKTISVVFIGYASKWLLVESHLFSK